MINHSDRFVECSVVMSTTERPSTIKKVGDRIQFVERSEKGIDYKVEFLMRTPAGDRVVATTEPTDGVVPIGHDFIWSFCQDPTITCVRVLFDENDLVKTRNGHVVVNPCPKVNALSDLREAFEAGRAHSYDAFNEESWDFDHETFDDWYNEFKNKTK